MGASGCSRYSNFIPSWSKSAYNFGSPFIALFFEKSFGYILGLVVDDMVHSLVGCARPQAAVFLYILAGFHIIEKIEVVREF